MHNEKAYKAATQLTKDLIDRGRLIEAGFAMFAHFVMPKDVSPLQLSEMQLAYMAGAEHVWSSVMNMLDPGEDPTTADLSRMDKIQKEIDEWRTTLQNRMPRKT